jgi:hypothetical protein
VQFTGGEVGKTSRALDTIGRSADRVSGAGRSLPLSFGDVTLPFGHHPQGQTGWAKDLPNNIPELTFVKKFVHAKAVFVEQRVAIYD